MAFDQFTLKRIEVITDKFLEKRRPPAEIRDQIDLGFRIENQSVVIFETRAIWDIPGEKYENPVAKATFVATQNIWKIFWMRSDSKWHGYDPLPEVERYKDFLEAVDEDEFCCFWG